MNEYNDTPVTSIDQKMINEFGINMQKINEWNEDIKKDQEELNELDDIEAEMMMIKDDDGIRRLRMGDVFMQVSEDDFNQTIELKQEKIQQEIANYRKDIAMLESRQGELKKILYSKFGDQINLEL